MAAVKKNLLDLPLEMVRAILDKTVRVRGVKRALRLRLVNKLFAEEIIGAMSRTKIMDGVDLLKCHHKPVFSTYLEQRILQERTKAYPILNMARSVAERLAREDGDLAKFRYYVTRLVLLLLPCPPLGLYRPWSHLFDKDDDRDEKLIEHNLLVVAAFTGKLNIVKTYAGLLGKSEPRLEYSSGGPTFGNAYYAAILGGHIEVLGFLFSVQGPPNLKSLFRILSLASLDAEPRTVEFILRSDWSPFKHHEMHDRDSNYNFEIYKSLHTPHIETFNMIVAEKDLWRPRPLQKKRLLNLFKDAVSWGWVEMTRHLFNLAAPRLVPGLPGPREEKLAALASSRGSNATLELLFDHGALLYGCELLLATEDGHPKTVKLLLEHGADVHRVDRDSIARAASKGYLEIVKTLLDYGADVNQPPDSKKLRCPSKTPIAYAVELEHTDMVRLLIERGASLYVSDVDEALRNAEANGLESMVALLRSYYDPDYLGLDALF